MSLEHPQELIKVEDSPLKGVPFLSPEARGSLLVAELLLDLIEEVRWLRNDLNKR